MSLAVPHIGGNVSSPSGAVASDIWASVGGSLIVAVAQSFADSGSPVGSDISDNKGNTYTVGGGLFSGNNQPGVGIYYNSSGTRGAGHQVTSNPPGFPAFNNIAVIEITGAAAAPFDATTLNATRRTSGGSPWAITAAGPIVGNQIAIYAITIDANVNAAFTDPAGYTNIINQPNGTTSLVSYAAYKINATGTPTVAATSAHSLGSINLVLTTFREAATADPTLGMIQPIVKGRFA